MHIALAFDLKDTHPAPTDAPDDWQEEFDSPETIAALADVLRALGHRVSPLGNGRALVAGLLADRPDLVFNLAEGQGVGRAREARVPALCELLGIPCTGSDPLTLAVALDKSLTRTVVAAAGVAVARGITLEAHSPLTMAEGLPFPVLVKPAWEGSSKGVRARCLVHTPAELAATVAELRRDYAQPLLVEEFIPGDELTVGLLGPTAAPRVWGTMRIRPVVPTAHFVYSLEVKRDFRRQVVYDSPPAIDPTILAQTESAAVQAYQALGCRDVARLDFRLSAAGPIFLEANPLPGINPGSSDLVIMSGLLGRTHAELIAAIVQETQLRMG
jgi:D-alanine-D-alanine ligase